MTSVQTKGLITARERMLRAQREFETARLREVAYRGVHYDLPNRPEKALAPPNRNITTRR